MFPLVINDDLHVSRIAFSNDVTWKHDEYTAYTVDVLSPIVWTL